MFTRLLISALALGAAASPVVKLQQRQSVPVGTVITSCTVPNTVALTFDDGPFSFTEQILNELSGTGIKATFFINGQNWGSIQDHTSTVQRMVAEGHQVGSHTWSHPDLATISPSEVQSQMTQLENTLLNILGKFPTYMRPPYFSYNDQTLQTLGSLGYRVIRADIDTKDYANNTPNGIGQSISLFSSGLDAGGSITLAHDVHKTTADLLLPAMIAEIQERGLRGVTVGECLGEPEGSWYRTSRG